MKSGDLFLPIQLNVYIYNFVKKILGVKKCTQNDFVYGELGRTSLSVGRCYNIIKYWLKILMCDDCKYIKYIYKMMLLDLAEAAE